MNKKKLDEIMRTVRKTDSIKYPTICPHRYCEKFDRCGRTRGVMRKCDDFLAYHFKAIKLLYTDKGGEDSTVCMTCNNWKITRKNGNERYCCVGRKNAYELDGCRKWEPCGEDDIDAD